MSYLNVIIKNNNNFLQDSFGPQTQGDAEDVNMKDSFQFQNNANNVDSNVENEDNSKRIQEIINLKLKIFFNYLVSIFKRRDSIYKVQFFTYLKSNKSQEKENSIELKEINKILISQMIYHKLNNCTKNIFYIYKNFRIRKKIKYFEFWRRYNSLCITLENEFNTKNSYDKRISDLNKKIKNMNKIRDNLKLDEKKINKSVQIKEEQKNNVQKNIKNLSNKCKELQKENTKNLNNNIMNVKSSNNNRNNVNITTNSTKNKETEEKKVELESNLRKMKEEDLTNDKQFKNFISVLDNNLNKFQAKANDIIRQKRQRSLEISKVDYEINNKQINNIHQLKSKKDK